VPDAVYPSTSDHRDGPVRKPGTVGRSVAANRVGTGLSRAFVVERRTFDQQGPFEFAIFVMRADRYQIRLRLARG
jgi:hypothetical protein